MQHNGVINPMVVQPLSSPESAVAFGVRGFLSLRGLPQLLENAEKALALHSSACSLIFDFSRIDGFEPGVPAKIIYWVATRADRVRVGVIVTSIPGLAAALRTAQILTPSCSIVAVASYAEALQHVTRSLRVGRTTGVRLTNSAVIAGHTGKIQSAG